MTNDYLAKQNPHPRDAHIHFDEGPHKYTIDGINGVTADTEFTSVTTFIHQHFEHFDAKKVIEGMMRNQKKWNDPVANAKYYGKTAEEIEQMWADAGKDASTKGTAMHHQIECFYNTPPAAAPTDSTADVTPEFEYFLNFNQEHVTRDDATLRPYRTEWTVFQEHPVSLDCALSSDNQSPHQSPHQSSEAPAVGGRNPHQEYVTRDDATLRPYRTEWTVFHEEAQIAGSIDMVYEVVEEQDPPSTPHQSSVAPVVVGLAPPTGLLNEVPPSGGGTPLAIYDWKRCREIIKTNRAGKFATHPAIEHIPDTNFWHYALQLNTYKYILQTKYGKTITDLYLIVLHPDAQNYQRVKLPDLQTEVAELFEERIRQNKKA